MTYCKETMTPFDKVLDTDVRQVFYIVSYVYECKLKEQELLEEFKRKH